MQQGSIEIGATGPFQHLLHRLDQRPVGLGDLGEDRQIVPGADPIGIELCRCTQERSGFVKLSLLAQEVAQDRMRQTVGGVERNHVAKERLGFVRLALRKQQFRFLEIMLRWLGHELARATEAFPGLILLAPRLQEVAKPAICRPKIWLERYSPPQGGHSVITPSLPLQSGSQIVVRNGEVGVQADGPFEAVDRRIRPAR